MKFYCDKCNAKYAISDEKVRGKILKVRCKKCSHIITVREQQSPVAAAAPAAPSRASAAQIAWHYSVNGQSYGPFSESALVQMYTDGSVPEASYVWNESFAGWKPVMEVEPFAGALRSRHEIRPPARTMGVSGALQAISLDDYKAPQEEEGVAPEQPDLSGRLDALRDKLNDTSSPQESAKPANPFQKKATDSPKATAPANPFGLKPLNTIEPKQDPPAQQPEALPEPEVDEPLPEQTEVETPALDLSALGAMPNDLTEDQPEPASAPLQADDLFGDEPEPFVAPTPDFPTPSPSSDLDFNSLPQDNFSSESFGSDLSTDSGAIDFSAINNSAMEESSLVLGSNEQSEFVASNSLLIQLDEIKKQGRSKRVAKSVIGVLLLIALVAGGGFMWYKTQSVKKDVKTTIAKSEVEHKNDLVIPTYKKVELMTFGEEEVIKISETSKDFEDENPKNKPKVESKTNKRVVVAKNTRIKPKSIEPKKPNLGINANDLTRGSNSGLDNALKSSKSKSNDRQGGLRTTKDNGKSANAKVDNASKGSKNLALSMMGRKTKINRPIYKSSAASKNPLTNNAPPAGTLTKVELKQGFKKIRRSVGSCYQRHVRRGLPFDSPKIKVTVEILGSGKVSRIFFKPSNLSNTEFGRCMGQRKHTWSFREYGGGSLKVGHTYVLQ